MLRPEWDEKKRNPGRGRVCVCVCARAGCAFVTVLSASRNKIATKEGSRIKTRAEERISLSLPLALSLPFSLEEVRTLVAVVCGNQFNRWLGKCNRLFYWLTISNTGAML